MRLFASLTHFAHGCILGTHPKRRQQESVARSSGLLLYKLVHPGGGASGASKAITATAGPSDIAPGVNPFGGHGSESRVEILAAKPEQDFSQWKEISVGES